jgi:hypothetical protein
MTEEQAGNFEQAVTERFEPNRAELVASLRQLIEHKYVPDVAQIHFEVYCDQFHDSFPVNLFYLDKTGNEERVGRPGAQTGVRTRETSTMMSTASAALKPIVEFGRPAKTCH